MFMVMSRHKDYLVMVKKGLGSKHTVWGLSLCWKRSHDSLKYNYCCLLVLSSGLQLGRRLSEASHHRLYLLMTESAHQLCHFSNIDIRV